MIMKYIFNFFRLITALAGSLGFFCLFTPKWLTSTFGENLNVEQILFHLTAPTSGVSQGMVIRVTCFFIALAAGGMCLSCLQN